MWTASNGIFQSTGTNLIFYKKYLLHRFVGIRSYDKTTGYTSIPFNVPEDIFFSEDRGFYPLTEYQGQIYMLRTEAAASGIWVLRGPSHELEKICSLPEPPEILKIYLFSLHVSADVIIISGDRRSNHDLLAFDDDMDPVHMDKCSWMLEKAQGTVFNRLEYEWDSASSSQFMFEIRFDGIP